VKEKAMNAELTAIDEYIASFPEDIQAKLQEIRQTIKAAAPDATEKIAYGMPTFFLKGNLVHFAAFKHHIGFYPAPRGIDAFQEELSNYKGAKGSVQFPIDEPMPLDLIRRIVEYRVSDNLQAAEEKAKAKKKK
jgi:uncharacterized protein YdhG (YjbR/CyaY superfamily)